MGQVSTQFGTMFSAHKLEQAVELTLKKWFPTYLRQVEVQHDLLSNTLKTPENYSKRNSFDAEPGQKVPKVVIISDGTIGTPGRSGNLYYATWSVGIGVAVAGANEEEVNTYSKCFGAAVRGILIEKPALESDLPISDVTWLVEEYNDLPIPNVSNLYKSVSLMFAISVENVVSKIPGPSVPDAVDYPSLGLVREGGVIIDLEKEPIANG